MDEDTSCTRLPVKGRGSSHNPPNRFEPVAPDETVDVLHPDELARRAAGRVRTEYLNDATRQALARNDSPDVPFTFSVNPYRGCEHGCIYCYARPSHEYLGFSSGLDFETRIVVKAEVPRLLDKKLSSRGWQPQVVALSGNTDCYQPAERKLGLTRQCLDVFLAHRNPVAVITKNDLILRDLDVLQELAARNLVRVTLSVTTLDDHVARTMEPRAAPPQRRLQAVRALNDAGVPTGVNIAPVVPGLTEHEIPAILEAAAEHRAIDATFLMLRLPHAVKELFYEWLEHHFPDRAGKVLHAIEAVRGGQHSDPRFGTRHSGEGMRAELIARMFELHRERLGLGGKSYDLSVSAFRREISAQGDLFEDL